MGPWASHPRQRSGEGLSRDHPISRVRHQEATIKVVGTVMIPVLVRVFGVWCSVFPRGVSLIQPLHWLPPHLPAN